MRRFAPGRQIGLGGIQPAGHETQMMRDARRYRRLAHAQGQVRRVEHAARVLRIGQVQLQPHAGMVAREVHKGPRQRLGGEARRQIDAQQALEGRVAVLQFLMDEPGLGQDAPAALQV